VQRTALKSAYLKSEHTNEDALISKINKDVIAKEQEILNNANTLEHNKGESIHSHPRDPSNTRIKQDNEINQNSNNPTAPKPHLPNLKLKPIEHPRTLTPRNGFQQDEIDTPEWNKASDERMA